MVYLIPILPMAVLTLEQIRVNNINSCEQFVWYMSINKQMFSIAHNLFVNKLLFQSCAHGHFFCSEKVLWLSKTNTYTYICIYSYVYIHI